MARPKEFDRDAALRKAMLAFWERGYEATSTEDIARAMGIGRQSMYDTFGDKHSIYMQALQLYLDEQGCQLSTCLADEFSPLRAIEAVLVSISAERPSDRARGCMLVSAIVECAHSDADVQSIVKAKVHAGELAFQSAVQAAQAQGQLSAALDSRSAGRFLFATVQGLRVLATAGTSPEALRDVAQVALAAIGAR